MNIGILGLGLMGASFAKTLHAKSDCKVYGFDCNDGVLNKALSFGIIDERLDVSQAKHVDMLVVALYPRDFESAVEKYLPNLQKGTIIIDFCGTKRLVVSKMQEFATAYPNLNFVGGHPMAGREYSGIEHSVETLFLKASMILVPCAISDEKLKFVKDFFLSLGFLEVIECSAEHHDAMIAYTSQLCHVVSNAFIKNDSAKLHTGYSAGSYLDLTRVAKMNSRMWAELMIDNRDKLLNELKEFQSNLDRYREALENGDESALFDLLEEGNRMKVQIDSKKRSK